MPLLLLLLLVGLPRCHRVGADRGHGKQNSMGGISSKCVYSHWRLCTRRLQGNQCFQEAPNRNYYHVNNLCCWSAANR